jgi:hypothetical protein
MGQDLRECSKQFNHPKGLVLRVLSEGRLTIGLVKQSHGFILNRLIVKDMLDLRG